MFQTCWGLLRTPILNPNCEVEPKTAAATVTTSIKVTLGRGGSRSGCCAEAEEKGKLLSCSSGLGCFTLLSLRLLSACTRGCSGWLTSFLTPFIRQAGSSNGRFVYVYSYERAVPLNAHVHVRQSLRVYVYIHP